jgi:hypothetical protein
MTQSLLDFLSPNLRQWLEEGAITEETACRLQGIEQILGETFVARTDATTPDRMGSEMAASVRKYGFAQSRDNAMAVTGSKGTMAFITNQNTIRTILREDGHRYDELRAQYARPDFLLTAIERGKDARSFYRLGDTQVSREENQLTGRRAVISENRTPNVPGSPDIPKADKASILSYHNLIHKCSTPTS